MWRTWLLGLMGVAALGCEASGSVPFVVRGDAAPGPQDGATATDSGGLARDAVPIRDTGSMVISPDAACATTTADARRRPMNLLIVLDRSGSMADNGKWNAAVRGVRALLERLDDDTGVGLTLFPSSSGADSMSGYTTPVVPVAPLSTSRMAINVALSAARPTGNTPMACALQGTMQYYGSMFALEGSRNVVLITDGAPTQECSGVMCSIFPPDLNCLLMANARARDAVQVAAARGRSATPPVRTFVAGTPDADEAFLSTLAVTGNSDRAPGCRVTNTCHYALGTGTFEADLNAALDDIRGRALTCEFTVNADPSRVDPMRVNVNYTPGDGMSRVIPRDVSHANGWDYANGTSTIVLYGAACDAVRTDRGGRVEILFGCPTVTPG